MKKAQVTIAAVALLGLSAGAAQADLIVAGNSASIGSGPIGTFDFTTNTPVGSFIPQGATTCPGGGCNGRGLAMTLDRFFYTELGGGGFGASDAIHIAPYNNGLGGADIGTFANPIAGKGIQALAFGQAGLYVLTGYPNTTPTVYILNGVTGAKIGSPIVLQGADPGMDGFTVLPDGTFFGNLGDADNSYVRWDAAGNMFGPHYNVTGCGSATGVDVTPDGKNLMFMCNFNSYVETSIANVLGNVGGALSQLASISAPGGAWEDIAIQQQFVCQSESCVPQTTTVPEPGTLALIGSALAGMIALRRRRKS